MDPSFVNPPLIAIIGPTASGKSALALRLAKKVHGAVISADSQQIYQHARIGTNQPNGRWQTAGNELRAVGISKVYLVNNIAHFFINELSPAKQYSAAEFQTKASKLTNQLSTVGFIPILVGGTGLYLSAIVEGYNFPKSRANIAIRKRLNKLSTGELQNKLKSLDIKSWQLVDLQNRRRLIRAIEHFMITGRSLLINQRKKVRPNTLILGLRIQKATLQKTIRTRTEQMFKRGLVSEVKYLRKNYPTSPLLKSIGYREVIKLLDKEMNKKETQQQINTHSWQYARRQMTWFKRIPDVDWINSTKQANQLTQKFLAQFN